MMSRQCCRAASHHRNARLSQVTASVVPGALLILLPKCPLCFAAWLTLATGISFSAAGAMWLRELLVVFSVIAGVLTAGPLVLRPIFGVCRPRPRSIAP